MNGIISQKINVGSDATNYLNGTHNRKLGVVEEATMVTCFLQFVPAPCHRVSLMDTRSKVKAKAIMDFVLAEEQDRFDVNASQVQVEETTRLLVQVATRHLTIAKEEKIESVTTRFTYEVLQYFPSISLGDTQATADRRTLAARRKVVGSVRSSCVGRRKMITALIVKPAMRAAKSQGYLPRLAPATANPRPHSPPLQRHSHRFHASELEVAIAMQAVRAAAQIHVAIAAEKRDLPEAQSQTFDTQTTYLAEDLLRYLPPTYADDTDAARNSKIFCSWNKILEIVTSGGLRPRETPNDISIELPASDEVEPSGMNLAAPSPVAAPALPLPADTENNLPIFQLASDTAPQVLEGNVTQEQFDAAMRTPEPGDDGEGGRASVKSPRSLKRTLPFRVESDDLDGFPVL
ncbi:hypothetical protein C8R43DRAFT_942983 [Mycena crocata]|nr:hypothetical protein C8R43DRAFT_942983 [Mycena crocata]